MTQPELAVEYGVKMHVLLRWLDHYGMIGRTITPPKKREVWKQWWDNSDA